MYIIYGIDLGAGNVNAPGDIVAAFPKQKKNDVMGFKPLGT